MEKTQIYLAIFMVKALLLS